LYRTGPAAVAIVTVLALASCGGGGSNSAGTGTSAAKAGSESKAAAQTDRCVRTFPRYARKSANACGGAGGAATSAAKARGCQARIGEFVGRMNDLRHSLLAGLSYAEYVVRVRAIRDAYETVPVDKLPASCLVGAAGEAEGAFNQYLRAANVWGECAGTEGCAASEIEGKLQRRWRLASKRLDEAQKG
jgi:hypothetical protein